MSILPLQYPETLETDIFVNFCKAGTQTNENFHYHTDHYEICFVLNGVFKYSFNYETHAISAYEVIFINKNTSHLLESDLPDNSERIIVNFNDDFLFKININPTVLNEIFTEPVYKVPKKYISEMIHLFTKIAVESDYMSIFSKELIEGYMREFLVVLYRLVKDIPSKRSLPTNTVIEMTTKYICQNFSEDISLDKLAEYCNINKFHLSKLFKEIMGVNLIHYINVIRIHEASILISETDKTLSEISRECGYNSLKHFCGVFKQLKGITAGKFRKLTKNKKKEDYEP